MNGFLVPIFPRAAVTSNEYPLHPWTIPRAGKRFCYVSNVPGSSGAYSCINTNGNTPRDPPSVASPSFRVRVVSFIHSYPHPSTVSLFLSLSLSHFSIYRYYVYSCQTRVVPKQPARLDHSKLDGQ